MPNWVTISSEEPTVKTSATTQGLVVKTVLTEEGGVQARLDVAEAGVTATKATTAKARSGKANLLA
jgi:hypothetical protein